MSGIARNYRLFWSYKPLCWNAFFSILFLIFSLFINYLANIYATVHASNSVTDLFLSNLPVINVYLVFYQGFILLSAFIAFLLVREPAKISFVVKSISIFILIRAFFLTLTHIGAPRLPYHPDQDGLLSDFTSGEDMFFSMHTGLPFLMALMFWENRRLKYLFIAAAFVFGAGVLVGHLHYSIDVFAAPFMAYSIFCLVQRFFPADYRIFTGREA
ncbi:MAG: phosphatase PAP2-related protein [Nitrospiraceae bacterium]|nr:phosphatase PAP2-related protein [Nitrospiraceae bacterium]